MSAALALWLLLGAAQNVSDILRVNAESVRDSCSATAWINSETLEYIRENPRPGRVITNNAHMVYIHADSGWAYAALPAFPRETANASLDDVAVIAGADNPGDIETFGSAKIDRFETFIELPNGIPSHGAFGRVFSLIAARRFPGIFIEWTKRVGEAAKGQVAAIDGKTVAAPPTRRTANSPSTWRARGRPPTASRLGRSRPTPIPTRQPPSPNCSDA